VKRVLKIFYIPTNTLDTSQLIYASVLIQIVFAGLLVTYKFHTDINLGLLPRE